MKDLESIRAAVLAEAEAPKTSTGPWGRELLRLVAAHVLVAVASVAVGVAWLDAVVGPKALSASLLAVAIALALVAAMLPGASRGWLGASAAVVLAAVCAHVVGLGPSHGEPWFHDADCALAELGVAVVPVAVTLIVLRGFASRGPRTGLGAAAAAATGLLVLDLTCPSSGPLHGLLFHLAPAALVVVVAVVVRARASSRTHVP